eukprot:217855_1
MVCRNEEKANTIAKLIRSETNNQNIDVEIADISLYASVREFAERYRKSGKPIKILINNAAIYPRRKQLTSEGLEMQFATNVMGYFWMITELEDILISSAPSRVINVASYWAGGLNINDLQFESRTYDNDDAYRQSKQADRMLSVAFSERLKKHSVVVQSCHPGDLNSNLSNSLGFGGHETACQRGGKNPSVARHTRTLVL